jgi:hypothetical protein
MRTGIVTALLAAIALAFFNPSMDDFSLFVRAQSEQILIDETGDTSLGRALSAFGSRLAGDYVHRVTERRNYFVFSTYTIDLDGPERTGNEWRFLGIGGRFIELDRPEVLREGAERG